MRLGAIKVENEVSHLLFLVGLYKCGVVIINEVRLMMFCVLGVAKHNVDVGFVKSHV